MDQARLSQTARPAALCRSLPGSAGAAAGRAAARLDDPVSQSRLDRAAANGCAREGVRFSTLRVTGDRVARLSPHRHCERSEAIQTVAAETVWIASSLRSSQ